MQKEELVWGKFTVGDGTFPGSCPEEPRRVTWRASSPLLWAQAKE